MAQNTGCEVRLLHRCDLPEDVWNAFVEQSPQRSPYLRSWYLDVVWQGWSGILVYQGGKLMAVMPLRVSKKYGLRYVFNPPLCQYTGICFGNFQLKNEATWALKKKLVAAIVDAVPASVRLFSVNFSPSFDYPLPFYWKGYQLNTRFSYWLRNSEDKQAMFRSMDERTRTYINKARKSGLSVLFTQDVADIARLSKERAAFAFDYRLLYALWAVLLEKKMGHAIEVRDPVGRLHAGLVFLVDGEKLIHLFSAIDPAFRNLGGMSLAIWHTIEQAGPEISFHDFEGSMLEPVEKFFRGFNTSPVTYLQIKKNNFPRPVQWIFTK